MNLHVDIESACSTPVPTGDDMEKWIRAALGSRKQDTEINVKLVDLAEMGELNQTYRGKSGATNVLSFPAELPPELKLPLLGDIAICAPVVRREAIEQGKSEEAHWAHMTVHGTLHLLGFDHVKDEEARRMETLETAILKQLHYPAPYTADNMWQERNAQ
jgi:probable rRNA maturation factor